MSSTYEDIRSPAQPAWLLHEGAVFLREVAASEGVRCPRLSTRRPDGLVVAEYLPDTRTISAQADAIRPEVLLHEFQHYLDHQQGPHGLVAGEAAYGRGLHDRAFQQRYAALVRRSADALRPRAEARDRGVA